MAKPVETDSLYLNKLQFDPKLLGGFMRHFLSNPRLVFLIILSLLIAGIYSFISLPRELNPEVDIPYVNVVTTLPGANPLDVEELVTKKIEKEVANIQGLDILSSVSRESVSIITLQFTNAVETDEAVNDVKDRVESVRDLPEAANDPQVNKLDFNDQPVLQVSLTGETDEVSLSKVAQSLADELESHTEIRRVDVSGEVEEVITIALKPEAFTTYGLSSDQVTQAIQASDIAIPSGVVTVNQTEYLLTVDNQLSTIEELRALPLAVGSSSVTLGEVADIYYSAAETNAFSRYVTREGVINDSVTLNVYKADAATITDAATAAETVIDERLDLYPQIEAVTILNTADLIEEQFVELGFNFRDTIFLVFLTLFVFLGLRQAAVASLSIPLTFLSALIVMRLTGTTLNFLSLFSLLLALGLVVDDAIVIVQAAYRYSQKFSPLEMGLLVFRDFVVPIWTTTITTVWAFLPLLLATGIIGEFIKTIPIVVSSALLSSTAVAVFINLPVTTMLTGMKLPKRVVYLLYFLLFLVSVVIVMSLSSGSRLLPLVVISWLVLVTVLFYYRIMLLQQAKVIWNFALDRSQTLKKGVAVVRRRDVITHGLIDFTGFSQWYRRMLERTIARPRNRYIVYAVVAVFSLFSFSLLPLGFLKTEFFPRTDEELLFIGVEGPAGWQVAQTRAELEKIALAINDIPELESIFIQTGSTPQTDFISAEGAHLGYLTLRLVDPEDRERTSMEIAEELRQEYSAYNQVQVEVQEMSGGPPTGADLQVNLKGEDLQTLEEIAADFQELLAGVPGAINIDMSLKQSAGQIKVVLNEAELQERGLVAAQVAGWLRTAVTGSEVGYLTFDGQDVDMLVSLDDTNLSLSQLQNLVLPSRMGSYTLAEVAEFSLETNPTSIVREDQQRVVRVTAAAEGTSATELLATFQEKIEEYPMPAGYTWDVGGVNEENQRSVNSILLAMGISAILILITMVLQLASFRKSALVLAVIPLAVAGVFFNFTLLGVPLSFPALIGVLALFGIVVNNSIMLVEKINQNLKFGLPFIESITDACSTRIEAIFFTSLTTTLGLLPITVSDPFWRGLGGSIIAGLTVSGMLILVLLPALYVEIFQSSESKQVVQ